MNVHKRFIVQFFIQISMAIFILFLIIIITFLMIGYSSSNKETDQDLSKADYLFISKWIKIEKDQVIFEREIKELVKKQNGWLFVVTKNGQVIGQYNAPKNLPNRFTKGELAALFGRVGSIQAKYAYWINEEDSEKPIVFFGRENPLATLLQTVKNEVLLESNDLRLTAETVDLLKREKGYVQLLDSSGEQIDSYNGTDQPTSYTWDELIIKYENGEAYYDEASGRTILIGTDTPLTDHNLEESMFRTVKTKLYIIYGLLFLLLIISVILYARKFGLPLMTIMEWIQKLGTGNYDQPLDSENRPVIFKKNGKIKRKFRLYKDVISTLSQLTDTLRQNKAEQAIIRQTREEWISGLSHDLKTPLSSISGYAQMLKAEEYTWTDEEINEFVGVIAEKSDYMMDLLEDLTLTYRIKNNSLPLVKQNINVVEFLRRKVINHINNQGYSDKAFMFSSNSETIEAFVDPKWFHRIMDNLIINAIKYNPAGTTIKVSVNSIEDQLIVVTVEDDGIGMDQETQRKLFQRYFRGTNTEDNGRGTGLGMAITKRLVKLHNGSINVKSEPNKGTVLRIIIPAKATE